VIASIGIAGPASRLTPQRMEKVSGHVITAANQLSERLGFSTDPDPTVS
jgi:DNA-binding IclR family transcriptional regulator